MIIGRDKVKFLKNFLSTSNSRTFLLIGSDTMFEDLFLRHLLCEKNQFCKKCNACQSESLLSARIYEGESLKIEEARDIAFHASQSSLYGKKVFLIKTNNLADDAQATLLKTIEEPYEDTYFVISSATHGAISKPLMSRLTIFDVRDHEEEKKKNIFKLSLEDIGAISQNRDEVDKVFQNVEAWIEDKITSSNADAVIRLVGFIDEYFELKKRFFEKTYPPKMILEHLAISKFYIK